MYGAAVQLLLVGVMPDLHLCAHPCRSEASFVSVSSIGPEGLASFAHTAPGKPGARISIAADRAAGFEGEQEGTEAAGDTVEALQQRRR